MITIISRNDKIYSIIIRATYTNNDIKFFTPPQFSQQVAYMRRPGGYLISPHIHKHVCREVHNTQEVLFIKRGKVRVDLYDDEQKYLESRVLTAGDIILLAGGGHGFVMLEESEIIEVKQGPYAGEGDKARFQGAGNNDICIKE